MGKVIYMTGAPKHDYLGDLRASKRMARDIEKYWHDKGYKSVKVWVESSLDKMHFIRSNITWVVPRGKEF